MSIILPRWYRLTLLAVMVCSWRSCDFCSQLFYFFRTLSRCIYLSRCSLDCYLFYAWYIGTPAPVYLCREPSCRYCILSRGPLLSDCARNFELKKEKTGNTSVWAVIELKWVGRRPSDRVEYFTCRVFGLSTQWPRPRPFWGKLFERPLGTQLLLCTKFEVSSSSSFEDMFDRILKILGVT